MSQIIAIVVECTGTGGIHPGGVRAIWPRKQKLGMNIEYVIIPATVAVVCDHLLRINCFW